MQTIIKQISCQDYLLGNLIKFNFLEKRFTGAQGQSESESNEGPTCQYLLYNLQRLKSVYWQVK